MANSPPTRKAMAGNAFIKVRLRGVTRRQRWQYASDRMSFMLHLRITPAAWFNFYTLLTGFCGGNEFRGSLDQIQRFCRKSRCRASKVRFFHYAVSRILAKGGEKEMPSV